MKLNLAKCAFGINSRKFLKFIISKYGDKGKYGKDKGDHGDGSSLYNKRGTKIDRGVRSLE